MRKIDIICPIHKNIEQIRNLYNSIKNQKEVEIINIVFPLTFNEDEEDKEIIQFLDENNIKHFEETKTTFSHSLTREKAIRNYCTSDYVVLMSQDIIIKDDLAVSKLVNALNDEIVYVYGRQICTNKSIEKYIRAKNYPKESYVVSKDDVSKMQLKAFFASDAFSALDRNIFLKIGGYREVNTMMGEDMLYSKYIIDEGYKKAYVAEAEVEHSHKYTLKQLYKRYYDTGVFHKTIKIFDEYHATDSGKSLALYVLKQALKHFDIPVLFRWLPDMTARYLGMKKGKKSVK